MKIKLCVEEEVKKRGNCREIKGFKFDIYIKNKKTRIIHIKRLRKNQNFYLPYFSFV